MPWISGAGRVGAQSRAENDYDAVVLDVMLPKKDGITLCRELREGGFRLFRSRRRRRATRFEPPSRVSTPARMVRHETCLISGNCSRASARSLGASAGRWPTSASRCVTS